MRRVEIYGTMGPACQSREILRELFKEGMSGIRLNLSHSKLKEAENWILNMQSAAGSLGIMRPQLLVDLQGPELRILKKAGHQEAGQWELKEGETVRLGGADNEEKAVIPVPEGVLSVQEGQEILIDDGKILLCSEKTEAEGSERSCKVVRGGVLKTGKSIALPGLVISSPTLTEADLENLSAAGNYGVTGVMLPFVRNARDLMNLRQVLKENGLEQVRIFAKIENLSGVNALPSLLPYADEIVIARGDLGNAMPLWELPKVQKQIAAVCNRAGKPFMVVTQMLQSMEHASVPTRAEVSDIYNAVLDGANSVMVTGETAVGEYPAAVMKYLVNTVKQALLPL